MEISGKQRNSVFRNAFLAMAALLLVYFTVVTLLSGFRFAQSQFGNFWPFLTSLAVGFGIQIGLYTYLKELVKNAGTTMHDKTVAITGTTSTLAMVSCCAHYLANILPIIGIAGALTVVAQYQIGIFWVGIAFNLFGIAFIANKVMRFKKHRE